MNSQSRRDLLRAAASIRKQAKQVRDKAHRLLEGETAYEQKQQIKTRSQKEAEKEFWSGILDEGCEDCTPRRQRPILTRCDCDQGPGENQYSTAGCPDPSSD